MNAHNASCGSAAGSSTSTIQRAMDGLEAFQSVLDEAYRRDAEVYAMAVWAQASRGDARSWSEAAGRLRGAAGLAECQGNIIARNVLMCCVSVAEGLAEAGIDESSPLKHLMDSWASGHRLNVSARWFELAAEYRGCSQMLFLHGDYETASTYMDAALLELGNATDTRRRT